MTDEILDNPAPEASPSQSIIDTPEPQVTATQKWPDNWRHEMSGGDEKELKRLERMKSPADVFKSYRELEKIKSSFTPTPKRPGEGATEDEIKAYREYAGIPASPKEYDLSFDDGTAIGDDVMPKVEGFLDFAHKNNLPNDVVKSTLKFYMDDIAKEQEALYQRNEDARINGTAELKAEWGGEFKGNINAINSLFAEAPSGTMESLLNARGEDGLKFANNPDNIRWLVGLAKQLNPTASLLPSGVNDEASISTELDKLVAQMNSKDPVERDKYWKDPKAQERYLKLTQAKMSNR